MAVPTSSELPALTGLAVFGTAYPEGGTARGGAGFGDVLARVLAWVLFDFGFAAPAGARSPRLELRRSGRVRGRLLRTSRSPSAMGTSFLKREFVRVEAFQAIRNSKRSGTFHVVTIGEYEPLRA
jgi:hypothetical protein